MPSLGDLHCCIELAGSHRKLQEFGTSYADCTVESFVAVPSKLQPFKVRLNSTNFIAPGLAIHVFIDGVYQCNRNRQGLKQRTPPDKRSLVDFCVKQKEERQKDGSMLARGWSFAKLDVESANNAPNRCHPDLEQNIGCIEVVVLRCVGTRAEAAAKNSTKITQFDGAYDSSSSADSPQLEGVNDWDYHSFGLDGTPGDWSSPYGRPHYDDQNYHQIHNAAQSQANYAAPAASVTGVPASPYSVGSGQPNAWAHGPSVSPAFGNRAGITTGFQYGGGPIPHRTRAAPASALGSMAPVTNGGLLDLNQANNILTGVGNGLPEQSSVGAWGGNASQIPQHPGAWPASPFGDSASLHSAHSTAVPSQAQWSQPPPSVHTAQWNVPTIATPSVISNANQWNSGSVTSSADSSSTWGSRVHGNKRNSPHHVRAPSHASGIRSWGEETARPTSPAVRNIRTRRSSRDSTTETSGWGNTNDSKSDINSSHSTIKPGSSMSAFAPTASIAAPSMHTHQPEFTGALSASIGPPSVHSLVSPFGPRLPARSGSKDPADWDKARKAYANYMASKAKEVKNEETSIAEKEGWERAAQIAAARGMWGSFGNLAGVDYGSKKAPTKTKVQQDSGWASSKVRKSSGEGYYDIPSDDEELQVNGWTTPAKATSVANAWDAPPNPPSTDPIHSTLKAPKGKEEEETGWNALKTLKAALGDLGLQTSTISKPNAWKPPNNPSSPSTNRKVTSSPTKPHPSKSRLTQYHKHKPPNHPSPSAISATPKPHWQFPPPANPSTSPASFYDTVPAEPLHSLDRAQARSKGLEHQVRIGEGVKYTHTIGRPEYMDSFKKPYAVFRFKYRSASYLKSLFGDAVASTGEELMGRTSAGRYRGRGLAKNELEKMPRDALVNSVLELHTKMEARRHKELAGKEGEGAVGMWVARHSGGTSEEKEGGDEEGARGKRRGSREKGKDKRGRKREKEKGGWGETTWGGEG